MMTSLSVLPSPHLEEWTPLSPRPWGGGGGGGGTIHTQSHTLLLLEALMIKELAAY